MTNWTKKLDLDPHTDYAYNQIQDILKERKKKHSKKSKKEWQKLNRRKFRQKSKSKSCSCC